MSNWPECDAALAASQASGDPWGYCTVIHCDDTISYGHQFCNCTGQFERLKVNGVCPNGIGSLIPIADPGCYCCCSCFAYGTPIAVSESVTKAVQDFVINDPVWVATDASLKKWVQKPVLFSSGTGAHGKNRLIKIHFGDQKTGITVRPEDFVSKFVTRAQADAYFKILSTPPNNFIGIDGLVNLMMVRNANSDVISKLLAVPAVVGERIFHILNADSSYLLVTGIQPFLMKDGTLKQAQKLVPGKDVLLLEDGSTTPIVSLEVGMFEKGVHHIATSTERATSLDGHLLLANGIVVGDYSTQISLTSKNGLLNDAHVDAPVFGTKAYSEANTHLSTTPFGAYASGKSEEHEVDSFTLFHPDKSSTIPKHAISYITKDQALELLYTGPIYPASQGVAEPSVRYLFRLFSGFYPDITFYYDRNNVTPNAYAFEEYDQKFVVLNLGWTLVEGIYFHGIAMTIAHLVAALYDKETQPNPVGLTAQADYDVYPVFLSLFFFAPDAVKNYNLAFGQIKTVFSYIKKERNPVGRVSLDCRIDTLQNSIKGLPIPQCAGGPPDAALAVLGVSATLAKGAEHPVVTVTFNLPIDPETAAALGNYLFDPAVIAYSASVDENDPKKANIVADVAPVTEYYLVVTGVLSVNQQPVIIGQNGGNFVLN
ncbi:hypothetical protein [Pedobacter steynii]|uniref:Uncharacterized protein n=1 Tax=Pedobacter steynii TaxID=430522 RepID=A0A1D7QIA8_9SPHI|nr:hypothetical protein [Pedobacter steynii]AOM78412.1 hypothetical protein BFS30_15230 [Pedobacter steynii]